MNEVSRHGWSREEIAALLERESFGYQSVPLPFGLKTAGEDRSATAELIFPPDLTGKTVLDLGCSYGFFCFEAKRRGAARVVGVDVDPEAIRKARILASVLGLEVEFLARDIEAEPIAESFDYVLGLNLLHHMRDPLAVLDKLAPMTGIVLALEVASFGPRDRRRLGIGAFAAAILSRSAVIVPGPTGPTSNRSVQRFYFTKRAIRNVLFMQHGWFARLRFASSPHKARFIVLAERRRIGHLVVVTGPTASGKSTLIDRLWRGELPMLARRIGLEDRSRWADPINTNHLFAECEPEQDNVIWHYDLLRPYRRTSKTYERDEALEALSCARKITIVTIWTPPDRLQAQFRRSEIDRHGKRWRRPKAHRLKLLRQYEDPQRVLQLYKAWFAFVQRFDADHIVVTTDGSDVTMRTPAEWDRLVRPSS